jgi:hypothetical protein
VSSAGIRFTGPAKTYEVQSGSGGTFLIYDRTAEAYRFTIGSNGVLYQGDLANPILHAGNYNSYAPTLTGTGASGTWAISVSGNSATTSQRAFSGDISTTGQGRFTGWYAGGAATGFATEIGISGGQGYILSYNRDTAAYGVLNIAGSASNLQISGSTINVSSGSLQQGGNQVLHAGNYTSYSPSLGGSGASGNWNITATYANSLYPQGHGGNASTFGYGRLYNYSSTGAWTNAPSSMSYGSIYNFGGSDSSALSLELAADVNHNSTSSTRALWFRTGNNLGFQDDWKEILHSGNYSSYALPSSGGTLTGPIYSPQYDNSSRIMFNSASTYYLGLVGNVTSGGGSLSMVQYTSPNGTAAAAVNSYPLLHSANVGTYAHTISTNPGNQGPGVLAIGNNGSYSFVQSHAGQPLNLNPVGNAVNIAGNTALHAGNYTSYSPSLGGSGASGTWGINITGSANTANSASNSNTVGGLAPAQFFNNMGNNHSTYTDFNSVPGFGNYYLQQGNNGPTGVAANQFYGFTLGLGNEYPSSYGSQMYYPRRAQNNQTYIYVRDREGSSWTSWTKIRAGYADSSTRLYASDSSYTFDGANPYYMGMTYDGSRWLLQVSPATPSAVRVAYADNAGYATSASSASTASGLSLSNGFTLSAGSSNYGQFNSWVFLPGSHGFYSGVNGAYFYPTSGSYGAWRIDGSKDGWRGLNFSDAVVLMMNDNESGHHRNGYGWQFRWNDGTLYCHKNSQGGGTSATVLDSSNYTNYSLATSTSDSRYVRRDTDGQYLRPFYQYGSALTTESPATLRDQMGSSGGLRVDFMNPSYTGSGGWNHVITWSGYQFYNMYQLGGAYDGGTGTDLWVRSEANHGGTGWTAWRRLLNSSNYTQYSPSLTGSGASGTWGINVTGSAASLAADTSTRFRLITFTGEGSDSGNGSLPTSYGIYQQGGAWSHPYPDLCIGFHTGIKIGAYYGYNGTRFYNNSDWATEIFSVGNGDNNIRAADTIYAAHYRGNANVGGTGEATHHPAGIYSQSTNWLYGTIYTNGNTIDAGGATCSLTATRANRANGNFYIDDNYGCGVVGAYASTRYQGVFAMGDAYKLPLDGTSSGNLYGIAWSHPNAGGPAGNLDSHGMLVLINGGFGSCMSYSIRASGNVTAYSDERLKTNWRSMPDNYVARLAEVKVGIYDRTDGEKITQVGVGAQSLQTLLPEAIITAKDEMGTLSVNYGGAALASAVELAKEVVDLKTRVAELEALINKLILKD